MRWWAVDGSCVPSEFRRNLEIWRRQGLKKPSQGRQAAGLGQIGSNGATMAAAQKRRPASSTAAGAQGRRVVRALETGKRLRHRAGQATCQGPVNRSVTVKSGGFSSDPRERSIPPRSAQCVYQAGHTGVVQIRSAWAQALKAAVLCDVVIFGRPLGFRPSTCGSPNRDGTTGRTRWRRSLPEGASRRELTVCPVDCS